MKLEDLNLKIPLWLTASLVVLSFLFGQALPQFWKWEESRQAKQRLKIELRDKIEAKLVKFVLLTKELRQETDGNRKAEVTMQLRVINDDILTLEKNLAELEKRPSREIFKDLIPPIPTGIKLTE